MSLQPLMNTAIKAARAAGQLITRFAAQSTPLDIQQKGRHDYVTQVDQAVDRLIRDTLHKAYPTHALLTEEGGHLTSEEQDYLWLVDPVDGTTNLIHGLPHYTISIALIHKGHLQLGVIYDPLRDELFTAMKGQGAFLNQRRLRLPTSCLREHSLIGLGFCFQDMKTLPVYLDLLREIVPEVAGIRRMGSAALDLAYVACGRLDGFFEFDLKPWDLGAGLLLAQEVGACVTDLQGETRSLETGHVIAAHPKLHAWLATLVQKAYTSHLR